MFFILPIKRGNSIIFDDFEKAENLMNYYLSVCENDDSSDLKCTVKGL